MWTVIMGGGGGVVEGGVGGVRCKTAAWGMGGGWWWKDGGRWGVLPCSGSNAHWNCQNQGKQVLMCSQSGTFEGRRSG